MQNKNIQTNKVFIELRLFLKIRIKLILVNTKFQKTITQTQIILHIFRRSIDSKYKQVRE